MAYNGVIYGIETSHVWNGSFVFNGGGLPRVEVTKITGLFGLPEADDFRAPRTEQHGEIIYPSLQRGKTITYEGIIFGYSMYSLRLQQTNMVQAFAERSAEGSMLIGNTFRFYARPIALDMDDEQLVGPHAQPNPYQRLFVLSLRMSDPNYY